jgi:hypothetical protein
MDNPHVAIAGFDEVAIVPLCNDSGLEQLGVSLFVKWIRQGLW